LGSFIATSAQIPNGSPSKQQGERQGIIASMAEVIAKPRDCKFFILSAPKMMTAAQTNIKIAKTNPTGPAMSDAICCIISMFTGG
jgi:hypothetical protein